MGQQEVYDYLKKNERGWFTSKDIAKGKDVSLGSVTNCLKKLRKSSSINFREIGRRNQFEYGFKR